MPAAAKKFDHFFLGAGQSPGVECAGANDDLFDLRVDFGKCAVGNNYELVDSRPAEKSLVRLENADDLKRKSVDANFLANGIERAE